MNDRFSSVYLGDRHCSVYTRRSFRHTVVSSSHISPSLTCCRSDMTEFLKGIPFQGEERIFIGVNWIILVKDTIRSKRMLDVCDFLSSTFNSQQLISQFFGEILKKQKCLWCRTKPVSQDGPRVDIIKLLFERVVSGLITNIFDGNQYTWEVFTVSTVH